MLVCGSCRVQGGARESEKSYASWIVGASENFLNPNTQRYKVCKNGTWESDGHSTMGLPTEQQSAAGTQTAIDSSVDFYTYICI